MVHFFNRPKGKKTELALIHRGRGRPRCPVAKPSEKKVLKDWDLELYEIWLQRVAANPELYDDATIPHGWRCNCCSRTLFLSKVHKKK